MKRFTFTAPNNIENVSIAFLAIDLTLTFAIEILIKGSAFRWSVYILAWIMLIATLLGRKMESPKQIKINLISFLAIASALFFLVMPAKYITINHISVPGDTARSNAQIYGISGFFGAYIAYLVLLIKMRYARSMSET